ncbi:MAG: xanthine dehydrogenase family protein [Deltaproteobacteria bacterium]|nr:xanthine dehydrogenase family protein [Deltaproteobacteria bacterium]
MIGNNPIRIGAREKVSGLTRFGVDQGRPGDLYLYLLRAYPAPSRIKRLEVEVAGRLPGVVRIFTAADIPGINQIGIIPSTKDQPVLSDGLIRTRGDAVALVAAENEAAGLRALEAIVLELEPLAGVFDPRQALDPGVPLVHEKGNLLFRQRVVRGDAEAALAESPFRLRTVYSTSPIEHGPLEVEGGRAEWRDGKIVVAACTQNPHYDRSDLARLLGLPPEQIRVIQTETGGGFGKKLDLSVQSYLALAAYHLKRPVRMAFTREESFLGTAKRHALLIDYESGMDARGKLTAVKVDILGDSGAYASYGFAVCMRAAVHATGPYEVPQVLVDSRLVYTHNHWGGAMRGFGVPQVALAHEGQMDGLAEMIGLDPLELRLRNCLRNGSTTATGQVLQNSVGIGDCLRRLEKIYRAWQPRVRSDSRFLRGLGLGAMYYGIGNTGVSNPSTAQLEFSPSGTLTLYTGAAEIGQGSDTVLGQMAAHYFGLPLEQIRLVRGDTERTTSAGASSASRQTYISGNAVLEAARDLERILKEGAAELWKCRTEEVELKGPEMQGPQGAKAPLAEIASRLASQGREVKGAGRFDPPVTVLDHQTGQGDPYASYAFAAQLASVEVDTVSGLVRVPRVAAAHDVGRAIHRRAVRGQIAGGIVMGVGFATMEEFIPGKTDNFREYHLPTMADAPRITPLIIETSNPSGPYGAKGVGEPSLIPTAPAIANATSRALGVRMTHLPLSLERVMEALRQIRNPKSKIRNKSE